MTRTLVPMFQPKPGEKIDMRIIKTREAIAEAFIKLLETTAYNDITVTAIAQQARISRKTFYLHYSSIDELLRQIMEANIHELIEEVRANDELGPTATDALESFTCIVFDVFIHHPYLNSNLVRCMPQHNFLDIAKEPLVEFLTKHFESHGIPQPRNFDYWTSYYLGGLSSIYETWRAKDGNPETLEKLAVDVGASVAQTFDALVRKDQALGLIANPN